MKRRIIEIDENKCNGCSLCVNACHEGAIGIVDGKAKLLRDDYCDGLGDCLPVCPTGAITFVEREAKAYDEEAVLKNKQQKSSANTFSCPGKKMQLLKHNTDTAETHSVHMDSQLAQWPCQIKLVPVQAPFFQNAKLLIAADCTAYAYANMHKDFMRGKTTIIGCPKLDDIDYTEKLTAIIKNNSIQSITIVRMEVPCCGGLEAAATTALKNSGKFIPWQVVTISVEGNILD